MKHLNRIFTILIFIFMYIPMAVLIVASFNTGKDITQFEGFTLQQYVRLFQDRSIFTTIPALYADGFMDAAIRPTLVNPVPQGVISIASLAINVLALALIIKRSVEQKKNPYKQEIFTDTKDFQLALARAEEN